MHELKQQVETENSVQTIETDLYIELQEKIADLTSQNERLKQEVTQVQQEIGEVLLSARKQASQTIEEAQAKAEQIIATAKVELKGLSRHANKMLNEMDDSKDAVLTMYDELQEKMEQLVKETMPLELEELHLLRQKDEISEEQ